MEENIVDNIKFISKFDLVIPEADDIIVGAYNFSVSDYNKILFQQFNICCPDNIKSSVLKRQAEYLAGRYAASIVLDNLGIKVKEIATGKHRSPVWPAEISASITHTDTKAICAASFKDNYEYLGIDIEKRLSSKFIDNIKKCIINLHEENFLLKSSLNFEDAFTLTFSAKESLFKALYPNVGKYFDFSAAQIVNICCSNNSFTLKLLESLTPELSAGIKFNGYYYFDVNVLSVSDM